MLTDCFEVKLQNITIHVGFGRTGTTFLQNEIFPKLKIKYLGKLEKSYPDWLIDWNYCDRFLLQSKIPTIRKILGSKKALVSSEAFTQTGMLFEQLDRIQSVVIKPKIIVTIRNPVDLIISKYRFLVNTGVFKKSLDFYIDSTNRPFDLVKRPRLYLHDYRYDLYIDELVNRFGLKNILVVKYEDLTNDINQYMQSIVDFLECDLPNNIDFSRDFFNATIGNEGIVTKENRIFLTEYFKQFFDYEKFNNLVNIL